jgi:hypothetical protein
MQGVVSVSLAIAVALAAALPDDSFGAEPARGALPIPPGPLAAVRAALQRPLGTPAFPYGKQHRGTLLVYWQLRRYPAERLNALELAVHGQPNWLRQLTAEADAGGFDPHAPPAQVEGARLLWELVPFEYPPLEALEHGRQADTTATTFYDPASGVVSLSQRTARWPRAVSLLHEALHAQQSQPGLVTWEMLGTRPWSPRTWLYSAMRDNPRAMDLAVELGPSLASGLAIAELYHRCRPGGAAIEARLVTPSGRSLSVEWMLRQAHRHGVFGDTALARALGERHARAAGINELLGETSAGRQFVTSLAD